MKIITTIVFTTFMIAVPDASAMKARLFNPEQGVFDASLLVDKGTRVLQLDLPNERVRLWQDTKRTQSHPEEGFLTWVGTGYKTEARLTTDGNLVFGYLRDKENTAWAIRTGHPLATLSFPEEECQVEQMEGEEPEKAHEFLSVQPATAANPTTVTVDMYYTQQVVDELGSVELAELATQAAVDEFNVDAARSEVYVVLDMTSTNLLEGFDDGENGLSFMALSEDVATRREENNADLVALIQVDVPGAFGRANQFTGRDSSELSASQLDFIGMGLVTHEFGHNLGAKHVPTSQPTGQPVGIPDIGYGYTFETPTLEFTTVMNRSPVIGEHLHLFSNPDLTYEGIPIGTEAHNNAALINHVAPVVALFTDGGCTEEALGTICLNNDRFAVEVRWRDFEDSRGPGIAVPSSSSDSGIFFFFDNDNWELLVKVLDGCSINDHYWVFFAATTDVEFTLTVTDRHTGIQKTYFNPLGQAANAVTDSSALAVCP